MNAAEQLVPVATESLSWTEICARYSDQFVCLVEVMRVGGRSPEIEAAPVVGCGSTHDAADETLEFDPSAARQRLGSCWTPAPRRRR